MKNPLNSNPIAYSITALLILISFVIGSVRPLNSLRSEAEAVFYNGTAAPGEISPNAFNIQNDLEELSSLAVNAIKTADRYISDNEKNDSGYSNLMEAVIQLSNATDAREKYTIASNITANANKLSEYLLNHANLTETDERLLTANMSDIVALNRIIAREAVQYNDAAYKFNETLSKFPATIFKMIGLVKPLSTYSE